MGLHSNLVNKMENVVYSQIDLQLIKIGPRALIILGLTWQMIAQLSSIKF